VNYDNDIIEDVKRVKISAGLKWFLNVVTDAEFVTG
jgi:hypothetical protein